MPNLTSNYSFNLPLVNDATDEDLWGGYLNDNWDSADTIIKAVSDVANAIYPVGSIYINATVATNPGTLLGFGTWVAFGAGKVPVGLDSGDSDFDTAEETGGAKTHTLSTSQMPSHTHTVATRNTVDSGGTQNVAHATPNSTGVTTDATGGGSAHNNVQPYIVVYMWKRTA